MRHLATTLAATIILTACSGHSPATEESTAAASTEVATDDIPPTDILGIITTYLDESNYTYTVKHDKKGEQTISLCMRGDNERIDVRILVKPDKDYYQILAYPDYTIDSECFFEWLCAINLYNLGANNASVCITDDRKLVFWLARNTEDGAITPRAFNSDFMLAVCAADEDIPDIAADVQKLLDYTPESASNASLTLI